MFCSVRDYFRRITRLGRGEIRTKPIRRLGAELLEVRCLLSGNTILDYSTYFGGSSLDIAVAVAVDDNGYTYVVGHTHSSDFPTIPNPERMIGPGGDQDLFVAKLDTRLTHA